VRPPSVAPVPPQFAVFRIRLQTPLRLRLQQHLIRAEELTPLRFLEAVERRAAILSKLHADARPSGEARGAARWTERVRELHRNLRWQDWERYSNRQLRKVPMGGLVGEWEWEVEEDWSGWESLWLGQWLHVGKGTSMGLGQYRIEAV
jgi:hypothetical protein